MYRNGGSGPAAARETRTGGPSRWGGVRLTLLRLGALAATALLGGCATYHALPLAKSPNLRARLSGLRSTVPAVRPGGPMRHIDLAKPLTIDDIGLLAVLNDPALRAERGSLGQAQAALIQASLLPNPTASLTFQPLIGGAGGVAPSWSASLTEDVGAILTYRTRVKSAHFALGQVNADLLWQEWQVAQQARVLALNLYWGGRSIALARRELNLLEREVEAVRTATEAGNLDLSALAPLLAAKSSAEQYLAGAGLTQLRNWHALDALLGLDAQVRFGIGTPSLPPMPASLAPLIARLPERRPDLVALRLGYRSADQNVRTAIIDQFPAMLLGGQWDQDNTNTRNTGPTISLGLPIFDRNQGAIAAARATRRLLHEQYQSRLDQAAGTAQDLVARIHQLSGDVRQARDEAAAAETLSKVAQQAFVENILDERALVDYEATALQRGIEANALDEALGEARIALTVDLGLGLPRTRMALSAPARTPAR